MNNEIKIKLKGYSAGNFTLLKELFEEFLVSYNINYVETKKVLTECAMIASHHGCFENVQYLVSKDKTILYEKESGIFRMTAGIEIFNDFVKIIDYLFNDENKEYLNINTLYGGFLKECIIKEKLEHIKYIIEIHNGVFDFNNEIVIKTLVRNQNKEMFDFFIHELKLPIKENASLENWFLKNEHEDQWDKIKKRNLLLNLEDKLPEKNTLIKIKKI